MVWYPYVATESEGTSTFDLMTSTRRIGNTTFNILKSSFEISPVTMLLTNALRSPAFTCSSTYCRHHAPDRVSLREVCIGKRVAGHCQEEVLAVLGRYRDVGIDTGCPPLDEGPQVILGDLVADKLGVG